MRYARAQPGPGYSPTRKSAPLASAFNWLVVSEAMNGWIVILALGTSLGTLGLRRVLAKLEHGDSLLPRLSGAVEKAEQAVIASVVTSKPANGGHGKTGQRSWPGTRLFYSAESSACKFVFVRQLRGPHLST